MDMTLEEARKASCELYDIAKNLQDAATMAFYWLDMLETPVAPNQHYIHKCLRNSLERAGVRLTRDSTAKL